MELSSVFGGDSLKAADLQGREANVTISEVTMKKFDNGSKLVIRFAGKQKVLICNKTNANRIAYVYGTNTDNWVGQPITLYVDLVDFQGKPTEAIRVRPPLQRAAPARPTPDPISSGPQRATAPLDVEHGDPIDNEAPF